MCYRTLSEHLKAQFGCKVYKLSLDAGMSCPNRDGVCGTRGCIFCDGSGSFAQKETGSIAEQLELAKQQAAVSANRRSQVGTGDRSEKIRTYNFPQTRITDHRVKLTLYKMENVLDGDLDELIDYITAADQAEKLKENE